MKVVVVGTGGALVGSGITRLSDELVRVLDDLGHEVTRVVAGSRPRRQPNRLNLENVRAVVSETAQVFRATRAADADIVWLHTFGVPTLPALRSLLLTLAGRASGGRVIVEFHAFGLEDHVARAGRLQQLALRAVGRFGALLVTVHERAAAALAPFAQGRVQVLPNWVSVPDQAPPLPSGPPWTAIYVGGLVARKGIHELIEAMRLLDDVPIVLRVVGGPGDAGPAAVAAVRASAAGLVAQGAVTFVGELAPVAVRRELRRAHLFVLPSHAEGMPMAMLEAMAEARPLLVSAAGNMAEVVREAGCGVVLESLEASSIAASLRAVFDDVVQLEELGRRAHAAASKQSGSAVVGAAVATLLDAAMT